MEKYKLVFFDNTSNCYEVFDKFDLYRVLHQLEPCKEMYKYDYTKSRWEVAS